MPPRKIATQALEKSEPRTRKVRVIHNESYIDEQPVDESEVEVEEIAPETPENTIEEFLRSIESDRQLTLHVFALPNFSRDGRIGIRATERQWVTAFPFTADEVDTYRQTIQFHYPQGGMFALELKDRGKHFKKWEESIAAAPGYQSQQPAQQRGPFPAYPPPAIHVHQQETPPLPQLDPMTQIEKQAETFLKVAQVIKQLQPEAPAVAAETKSDESMEDKLFSAVLLKAVESKETPIERVLDALAGRNHEPSFMDSLGDFFRAVAPALGPLIEGWVNRMQQSTTTPAQPGATVQAQIPQQLPVSTNSEQGESAPVIQIDPMTRAYQRTIGRMIEDCAEQTGTLASAEAITDVYERFPDLRVYIDGLLSTKPEEVFDLCAMMMPNPQAVQMVKGLQAVPACVEWIKRLQEDTRETMEIAKENRKAEAEEDENQDEKDEEEKETA
jgi:hypothetical protein